MNSLSRPDANTPRQAPQPFVTTHDLATRIHEKIPLFRGGMIEHKAIDSSYEGKGVFVSGRFWMQENLPPNEPYPGATVDITSIFLNNRPRDIGIFPAPPKYLTYSVILTDTLDLDKLTAAQKSYVDSSAPPFALSWRQDPSSLWLQKGKLELLQYSDFSLGSIPTITSIYAELINFLNHGEKMAKEFEGLGKNDSTVQNAALLANCLKLPESLQPTSSEIALQNRLPAREKSENRAKKEAFIKNRVGTAKKALKTMQNFDEDPVLKNIATLTKAVFERPYPDMSSANNRFSEGCKLVFNSISFAGLENEVYDLSIIKMNNEAKDLEVNFTAFDYLGADDTSKKAIAWFKERSDRISNGGTKIGGSQLLNQEKAILTFSLLSLLDQKTFTAALARFRNESYILTNEYYNTHPF